MRTLPPGKLLSCCLEYERHLTRILPGVHPCCHTALLPIACCSQLLLLLSSARLVNACHTCMQARLSAQTWAGPAHTPHNPCLSQVWCCLLVVWFISVHGPRECSGAWQYDIGVGG